MRSRDVLILTSTKWIGFASTIGYSICQIKLFGTSELMESFLAGTGLFGMLLSLSQSGQLAEVFLPEYVRQKNEFGPSAANDAFCVVLNWLMACVIVCSSLFFFLSPFIVHACYPGFSVVAQQDTILVFKITCVFFSLDIAASFMKTVLNAEEVYGRPEMVGSLSAVFGCIILLTLAPTLKLWSLILAFAFGKLIAFGYYVYCISQLELRYKFVWQTDSFNRGQFFKTAHSSIAYAFATQSYSLVLNAALSRMPQGYFAIFRYVINLYAKLRGSITQPLITVFFTQFSNDYTNENIEEARKNTRKAIAYCLTAIGFIAVFIYSFGEIALEIAWGGKDFDSDDIHFAWEVLCWSSVALAIGGVGGVLRKIVVSIGRARTAYLYWTLSQLVTAAVVVLLARFLGVESLKYFILANAVLLAVPSWMIAAKFDLSLRNPFEPSLLRTAITLLLVALIAMLIAHLDRSYGFSSHSRLAAVFFLVLASSFTFASFLSIAWFSDIPGIRAVLRSISSKMKHRILAHR